MINKIYHNSKGACILNEYMICKYTALKAEKVLFDLVNII